MTGTTAIFDEKREGPNSNHWAQYIGWKSSPGELLHMREVPYNR